ncbi:MAG: transcriptional repressor LexA [Dehalococcoidia bacterium]|jgi:SOS regulatory protein LexA|nr:MAG: transcriptional repressor LexA [Dehalococcoidia bacterium]
MRKPGKSQTRQRILKFIHDFVDDRGYAPTVRDILRGCSLSSTAVVQHHLNVLEREGYIHRDPEVFRSIQLLDRKNTIRVPLLGSIAAGEPIPVPSSETWTSEAIEVLQLTEELTQGKEVYALKVNGLSMMDALIDDGDIVLMEPANTAEDGDVVAAWLKDKQEVTLKRFFQETGRICLQPANSQMKPIYVNPEDIEIQGRVIGVIRKL